MANIQEIQALYRRCGLEVNDTEQIRRDINTGNLDSKLNSDFSNVYVKIPPGALSNATIVK